MRVLCDSVEVCCDCLPIIVNGDPSSLDYYYEEPEASDRLKEIEKGMHNLQEEHQGELVPNYDAETNEGIDTFSRNRCECCGSKLAGKRFRMSIIG